MSDQNVAATPKRFLFVDVFRGWAVLFMIETHAVNAWLDALLRKPKPFRYLNMLNGFVAPSFLFIAGVSFAFVAHSRWDKLVNGVRGPSRSVVRLLLILALGYLMHLPRYEWQGLSLKLNEGDLPSFFRVDILQTIAVSLLVLYIGALITRKKKYFLVWVGAATLAALLATPTLWRIDFHEYVHPALSNYLNGKHNDLFPLFPWCVFLWAGALVGFWFLDGTGPAVPRHVESRRVLWILLAGVGLFVAVFVGNRLPIRVFAYKSFWLESPNWVLMRLSVLLVLFAGFWFLEQKNWHTSALVRRYGSYSLFVYVIHLKIIYSITGDKVAHPWLRQDNGALDTFLLLIVLLVVVHILTYAWSRAKKWTSKQRRRSADSKPDASQGTA